MNNIGINQTKTLEANRSLVLRLLHNNEPCSRADLARLSQLTQATITNIISEMIQSDVVEEIGLGNNVKAGRRSILLRIKGEQYCVIGIKLALTSFTVGIFNISGRTLDNKTVVMKADEDPREVLADIRSIVDDFRRRYNNVLAIGIAVPGPYMKTTGKIAIIKEANHWNSLDISSVFSKLFDVPVFVEQDANAGAMVNWWYGEYPPELNVLCHMLLSEGVGVGVVENGELVLGQDGMAGEIGHISVNVDGPKCQCGNRGCLELYCSAVALRKKVLAALPDYPESMLAKLPDIGYADIFDAMKAGDPLAVTMVDECAKYIGYGIVNIINTFNPGVIVLSDIMTQGGERMMEIIQETVKDRVHPDVYKSVSIIYNPRKTDPVLAGAAAIATDHIFREPCRYILKKREE